MNGSKGGKKSKDASKTIPFGVLLRERDTLVYFGGVALLLQVNVNTANYFILFFKLSLLFIIIVHCHRRLSLSTTGGREWILLCV